MHALVHLIERHKDFCDLFIKTVGVGATLFGAFWVVLKFLSDRKDARRTAELDLKRQAYADFFSAIPVQMEMLGKIAAGDAPLQLQIEPYKAMSRVQLVAAHDVFACLVARNALFHQGMLDLLSRKRTAMQLQAVVDNGDARMAESAANHWEEFWSRFKSLLKELNDNYRQLLPLARRDIGLPGNDEEILRIMERDQAALSEVLVKLG